ncbi:GNAT family N-acetyltransferase [Myxococcus stipitatus]|uniref:GNAT family N-acetyltransferase n=1 Tax=Myxococcus stipitatus TaxID=83455 RepID=UPI001F40F2A4|nr:GNAT family N-acetyltransferase [Myxococcus stipitatus]MCE9667284.1 GNAT family N-acetyltransferase [Myxococcus stipitatus]
MASEQDDFGPPRDEREVAAVIDILMHSYAMTPEDCAGWKQRQDLGNLRLLREQGQVAATLGLLRMGQWYGGRSVPVIGVGGVGVHPVFRGRGTATRLMTNLLREVRAEGAPLSILYPATQPLYRRAGYELAGGRYEIRVPMGALDLGERGLRLRAIEDSDEAAIAACYTRLARHREGWLDRGAFSWNRVRNPRTEKVHGFLVEGDAGVEGYVYLARRPLKDLKFELALTDVMATTPVAARRLLRFLGDHHSLGTEAVWYGGPDEPLLLLLREQDYSVRLYMHWMARVLDVAAALEARGWPHGGRGVLHLEVEDDLFPENQGRYVLEVADGTARVTRGGEGRLRLHVRQLATLYTGFASAQSLRAMGLVQGDDATLEVAQRLFHGPAPSMRDMF